MRLLRLVTHLWLALSLSLTDRHRQAQTNRPRGRGRERERARSSSVFLFPLCSPSQSPSLMYCIASYLHKYLHAHAHAHARPPRILAPSLSLPPSPSPSLAFLQFLIVPSPSVAKPRCCCCSSYSHSSPLHCIGMCEVALHPSPFYHPGASLYRSLPTPLSLSRSLSLICIVRSIMPSSSPSFHLYCATQADLPSRFGSVFVLFSFFFPSFSVEILLPYLTCFFFSMCSTLRFSISYPVLGNVSQIFRLKVKKKKQSIFSVYENHFGFSILSQCEVNLFRYFLRVFLIISVVKRALPMP